MMAMKKYLHELVPPSEVVRMANVVLSFRSALHEGVKGVKANFYPYLGPRNQLETGQQRWK